MTTTYTHNLIPQREYTSLSKVNYNVRNISNYFKKGDCRNLVKTYQPRNRYSVQNPYTIQTNGRKTFKMINTDNFESQMATKWVSVV